MEDAVVETMKQEFKTCEDEIKALNKKYEDGKKDLEKQIKELRKEVDKELEPFNKKIKQLDKAILWYTGKIKTRKKTAADQKRLDNKTRQKQRGDPKYQNQDGEENTQNVQENTDINITPTY
jgi:peptidoglycan hydrolase CwlO-like protein